MSDILKAFTKHPQSVDEGYWEHAAFASRFAFALLLAAGAALMHAILPFLFEKTASNIIGRLYQRTHNRGSASFD